MMVELVPYLHVGGGEKTDPTLDSGTQHLVVSVEVKLCVGERAMESLFQQLPSINPVEAIEEQDAE
jgi:hypothetical protein